MDTSMMMSLGVIMGKLTSYTWKDIVMIGGNTFAEEFPISGEMDGNAYRIDDFLYAVAKKYRVYVDDISTYMMDNIDFNPMETGVGAEECGCYINGIPEWVIEARRERRRERKIKMIRQRIMGIVMILFSILIIYICSKGVTVEDRDATGAFITLPLGLYYLFSRQCLII